MQININIKSRWYNRIKWKKNSCLEDRRIPFMGTLEDFGLIAVEPTIFASLNNIFNFVKKESDIGNDGFTYEIYQSLVLYKWADKRACRLNFLYELHYPIFRHTLQRLQRSKELFPNLPFIIAVCKPSSDSYRAKIEEEGGIVLSLSMFEKPDDAILKFKELF